ncbi:MAG: S-layer homology domain-containing protein, partial [Chloroflexota bacterium]
FLLFVPTVGGVDGAAQAADRPIKAGTDNGPVATAFSMAAGKWNVPQQVLMAVGWVESHWEQRGGTPSTDFGYGIMHITDRPDGTMRRAVQITGSSVDEIRAGISANVDAGAALLSDISHNFPSSENPTNGMADWYPAVAVYSGATDPLVRDQYAQQVFAIIKTGASAVLQSGEQATLGGTDVQGVPVALAAPPMDPNSDDYPPAIWVPAYAGNYTVGRPYPPLNTIIIHDTEGSYASAISWFQNPASQVSAHYVIRSSDGQVTQMVRDANTAWHAGNWDYNVRAIGIEHEGYMNQQGWYTEAMYQSSAALVRYLTEKYGIRKDRAHIIGHYQVPNQSHVDPGPLWDWNHYMSLVRRDNEQAARVDNTDAGFGAIPSQIDPQHYWWVYAGGYNGSSTYVTTSVVNQSSSTNSATWTAQVPVTGYYDLYAFIPYVDNQTPDTLSARYHVFSANGEQMITISQGAITDVGSGSWANLGKFSFNAGGNSSVSLSDWTGESGKNVWFDAMMWIPSTTGSPPPTPQISPTPTAPAGSTPTRTPTSSLPTHTPAATQTTMPTATAGPTWTPGPCGMRFTDLPDTYWAYGYVNYLYCHGAITGYSDGTFRPNNTSTRGQFTKILVLSFGWTPYAPALPTFSDVLPASTFYPYVESAVQHGVISGYSDGTFRPGNDVSRAQAAKILVLGKAWPLLSPPNPTFTDVLPGDWAYSYVETAVQHAIVTGYSDGTFRPAISVTRAQLSKMTALSAQSP